MAIDDSAAVSSRSARQRHEPLSTTLAALAAELETRLSRSRRETAQLQVGAERMSNVLSSMAEGVLAVDRDERILVANPAAASLLDLADVPLVGRRLWEVVRFPAIREAARSAFDGRETSHIEIELPRTQVTIALRASRLPGEPSPGVVLVLHDVTELRRLENLRREFVSNVSHELKTPLASIQAYTETLLDGAIDDQEHNVRFLKRISEQADRLHNLILDLLRLARIEAGTDVFEIQQLSARKIITQACDDHVAVARSKGVTLTMEPPGERMRLRVDPDGMRTILDNLLDNAINYTPEGGRICVRWQRDNDKAVIEVRDTGIGIPPQHLSRVFERFHRVDRARSRERGGTGLGLAIVKHLVQVFEGHVEVESEVDRGSTFRITLPLADSRRGDPIDVLVNSRS
jgi:two-component system phosphate regulon sensor histidine kinase PhoR